MYLNFDILYLKRIYKNQRFVPEITSRHLILDARLIIHIAKSTVFIWRIRGNFPTL